MIKLTFALSALTLNVYAQQLISTAGYFRSVDVALFHKCSQVEAASLKLAREVQDRAFFMEVFPRNKNSLFFPFPTEYSLTSLAIRWLNNYESETSPYALLYSVDGQYTFRCRDDQNKFIESSGLGGDPLELTLSNGKGVIWHFDMTPEKMAHVFVVTAIPLESINGEELMSSVKKQLGARFMFLYARNDPWFLGYSQNTLPYIFSDSFRRISAEEYRKTLTMVCYSNTKCAVGISQE